MVLFISKISELRGIFVLYQSDINFCHKKFSRKARKGKGRVRKVYLVKARFKCLNGISFYEGMTSWEEPEQGFSMVLRCERRN